MRLRTRRLEDETVQSFERAASAPEGGESIGAKYLITLASPTSGAPLVRATINAQLTGVESVQARHQRIGSGRIQESVSVRWYN